MLIFMVSVFIRRQLRLPGGDVAASLMKSPFGVQESHLITGAGLRGTERDDGWVWMGRGRETDASREATRQQRDV